MQCQICQSSESGGLFLKKLPIDIGESVEITVCHSCEMSIVEFVKGMIRCASRSREDIRKKMEKLKTK